MAKCEEGYLCDICGGDVEELTDSDLYLRFVIGLVHPETLHTSRERHIRCNPTLGQFIVDDRFEPVVVEGAMDKRLLDPDFVAERERLVSRGYRRLHILRRKKLPITHYPLSEIRRQLRAEAEEA